MSQFTVVTDIGVDDAIALVLLDRLMPKANKVLVTTYGNCGSAAIERNGYEFVSAIHGWKLAVGSKAPLIHDKPKFNAEDFHGIDGLWGVRPPNSSRKVARTLVDTGSLISLGPLTFPNEYLSSGRLKEVTIMAGNFKRREAEPNIKMDIDSAKLFFEKCSEVDVRVVPANVSRNIRWKREDIASLPETDNVNTWLKRLLLAWFENCPYDSFALHDPLAVYLSIFPEYATWVSSGVEVSETGSTTLNPLLPKCAIAKGVLSPDTLSQKILHEIFHNR